MFQCLRIFQETRIYVAYFLTNVPVYAWWTLPTAAVYMCLSQTINTDSYMLQDIKSCFLKQQNISIHMLIAVLMYVLAGFITLG